MVNIAVLHRTLPSYLASHPEGDQSKINVATACTEYSQLLQSAGAQISAQALVLDLTLLGSDPKQAVESLETKFDPELTVIVYTFAKWDLLESLRGQRRHLMRAPVSVRALRSSMIGLIVKQLTNPAAAPAKSADPGPHGPPPDRRFDEHALLTLQEIESVVDCECPNQVADLVIALNAFEDYSKQCQNRNAADARMHAFLARVTGHARGAMEYALKELCAFEKIDVASLVMDQGMGSSGPRPDASV